MTPTSDHQERDRRRRIRRVGRLARAMDTAVKVPGTGISFGLDSIIGLLPGIGDAAGGLIGLYIVNEARRLGMPADKLARMLANLGVDFAVGSVPVLGDAFDLFFKAHRRNLDIVLDHFGDAERADVADLLERRPEDAKDITPLR